MYTKNTKVVCTLGPSSNSVTEIENLASAGMNVARLNFSHGTYENHGEILKNIRTVEKKRNERIGVLQDLQGPKIRIGKMPKEGIIIKKGETIILTTKNIVGEKKKQTIIPIQYKNITKDVKKDDQIFIDDGLIQTTVTQVKKDEVICKVKIGGTINQHKGVNCPLSTISAKAITEKDKRDLEWGLKNNVDFVALSFVKSKEDIEELRKLITKRKQITKIIAKIERHEAVNNLKQIIMASDGVMVARGDLGIEIPPEQVPIVQKRIIHLANRYGKPVVTATQVLQSMVENAIPTRAEISDAANAVFDHTDAIMLSNESAVGKYPGKATKTLTKVAYTVEKELQKHEELREYITRQNAFSSINATCLNACEMAIKTNAKYIVVYTKNGYTARQIAKHRLYTPIITITPDEKTARALTLVWGINKVFINKFSKEEILKNTKIIQFIKKIKEIKKDDKIIIVCNASEKNGTITTIKI
jgi:pyruvate kinase